MVTHASILAWRIPVTKEPGELLGCTESDMTELSSTRDEGQDSSYSCSCYFFFPILSLTAHLVLFKNQCLLSNFNVATC